MDSSLALILKWAESNGLGINVSKTEMVLFTKRYKIPSFKLPTLGGKEVVLSKEAKYLGIILDSKLSWKRNTEERAKKAQLAFYVCKRAIGKRWGMRPSMAYWVYTSIIRPIMTYGALVWWNAVEARSNCRYLQRVQRLACMGITGCVKSTPQAASEVMLGLAPVDIQVEYSAARSALRLTVAKAFKPRNKGHSSILSNWEMGNRPLQCDYRQSKFEWRRSFDIMIPSREAWETLGPLGTEDLTVFTDGSKTDTGTGAGVFCEELAIKKSFRLRDCCSVFQAEIYAVYQAVREIRSMALLPRTISICIDSQAAIKALDSRIIKSKIVEDTRNILAQLEHLVKLVWVPGHSGVEGNEQADECAREGSDLPASYAVEDVFTPLSHYNSVLENQARDRFSRRWTETTACLTSRALWPKLNLKRTKTLIGLSRTSIRLLTGVLTRPCQIGRMAEIFVLPWRGFCRNCGGGVEELWRSRGK